MKFKKWLTVYLATMLILATTPIYAQAGTITSLSDTMSRLKISTAANHTIQFTTASAVDPGDTITITFPAGFSIGTVDYTDIDVADDGSDLTLAATPGSGAGSALGASFSGQVLTITENDTDTITAGSTITIEIGTNATYGTTGDQQITNPGSAASYRIDIGGTLGDSGYIAVAITDDDQVSVTATVDPSITFTITSTTVSLSNMTPSSNGEDIKDDHLTVNTNGGTGYSISGSCTSTGNTLRDGSGNTISWVTDGDASITAGTEEWGIKYEAGSGGRSGSTSSPTGYRALGTSENIVTNSTGPVSDDDTKATYGAAVGATTEAGTYTATITYIATGNF